uniref:Uncharacterized protein n=1 Tax=Amphimedon queenslandica TaxID=400682 RepID=A0A1X7U8J4_AMPQE
MNPADLPSRGMTLIELCESQVWFHGPPWLESHVTIPVQETEEIPPECMEELRIKNSSATLSVMENERGIGVIVPIEHFSSYERLVNCTVYVLSFVGKLKGVLRLMDDYRSKAEVLWLIEVQKNFNRLKIPPVVYLKRDEPYPFHFSWPASLLSVLSSHSFFPDHVHYKGDEIFLLKYS